MRSSLSRLAALTRVAWILSAGIVGAAEANLLRNAGFEDDLAPVWEKRTPESPQRSLTRTDEVARSGQWSLRLEGKAAGATRLRQGHDQSIRIEPGSHVELSAWVKSDLGPSGSATLQLYCKDAAGKILSQPKSAAMGGQKDWTRMRLLAGVPAGTSHVMAYAQIDGLGTAWFDDLELRIVGKASPPEPVAKIGLLTNLQEDELCYRNVKVLLGEGLVRLPVQGTKSALSGCAGAVVLWQSETPPTAALEAVADFARSGGRVFFDLRAFAAWRNLPTVQVQVGVRAQGSTVEERMLAGLRGVRTSPVAAGFQIGQTIPRADDEGRLLVLPEEAAGGDMEVLAEAPGGQPGLVRLTVGDGLIVAADVLSLPEPVYSSVGGYYKYLFLTNTLADHGPTGSLQFAEYYPQKLTYAGLVDLMRDIARTVPGIRFQEEGPACGDYRIYSLNLGREGAPMYLLYSTAHGVEWEPGYGLMTFARRVAEGRAGDSVDLAKVSIKIIPILNPSGYELRQRRNAHGVDLNRQGDYNWEAYGSSGKPDSKYGPASSDWKGTAPFSEPETQTYLKIASAPNLHCVLDFHGNTSVGSNKLEIMPVTAAPDNESRVIDMQRRANQWLRGRHLLQQQGETGFSQYLLARLRMNRGGPMLMNTSARGRYGLTVELTANYPNTYATVLQTEVTSAICRALLEAFSPEQEAVKQ